MKIFITGSPGCGKTTLIYELLKSLSEIPICGFYTKEIREGGERKGFNLRTIMTKKESVLAHIGFEKKFRVGKYGVDVEGFEEIISEEFKKGSPNTLYVIDEVGPMECCSKKFVRIIEELLSSDSRILGSVKLKGGGLMARIRNDPSVRLFHLTEKHRKDVFFEVLHILKAEYEGRL